MYSRFVSALKSSPNDSSNIPTPNIGFSKVTAFFYHSFIIQTGYLLKINNYTSRQKSWNILLSVKLINAKLWKCTWNSRRIQPSTFCTNSIERNITVFRRSYICPDRKSANWYSIRRFSVITTIKYRIKCGLFLKLTINS